MRTYEYANTQHYTYPNTVARARAEVHFFAGWGDSPGPFAAMAPKRSKAAQAKDVASVQGSGKCAESGETSGAGQIFPGEYDRRAETVVAVATTTTSTS